MRGAEPRISVVIPTANRADLLDICLESFADQSVSRDEFELVVVDDGSRDVTAAICEKWRGELPLRYFRQAACGPSPARNLGLFAAAAPLVLFFDDDEVATPRLLAGHLAAHEECPGERDAVLGFTTWSPQLAISPVMHYVTEVGQFLLSYSSVPIGEPLDFSYFWTGRISCKRSFLTQFGIFSQRMSRLEDIELGYRLWRHGMTIWYRPEAVNFKATPVDFRGFCRRCEIDGRALRQLTELHDDPAMHAYCETAALDQRWSEAAPHLESWVAAAEALENRIRAPFEAEDPALLDELWGLYRRCFFGFRWKGQSQGRVAVD